MENPLEIIATRRHEKLASKDSIYKLIADSYAGGNQYITGGHLFKYVKEGSLEFGQRQKRSYMFNYVQPICDTLTGFLYSTKPERIIPDKISYILDKASKDKSLNSFMETVAIHSQLYTVAVLVDSPKFDEYEIITVADRKEKVKNPYCILYYPWQIRDFYLDDNGCLEWIILDNSEIEKDDPFKAPYKEEKYSLWTKNQYFCVKRNESENKDVTWILEETFDHNLGKCPVLLHNFRDKNEDGISETPYENTAILTRTIYNWLSCYDELIHSGSFKMLFVGIEKETDLPTSLLNSGVGSLTVFPYNGKFSSPDFKGSGLEDVTPLTTAIDMVQKQIFSAFGLDKDTDKMYVQSGIAKAKEFEKCEAFLRGGASQLEQLESGIMEILCLWENIPNPKIEINYQKSFNTEEVSATLARLYQSLLLPVQSVKDMAVKEIIKKTFAHVSDKEMNEMLKDVDKELEAPTAKITSENILNEKQARQSKMGTITNMDNNG